MNLFTMFPLRLTIPFFLFLLALLAEGYTMKYNLNQADAEEEKQALALVTQDMTQLQGDINDRLRKGDWEAVKSSIASRGSNANVTVVVLVDDAGTITSSTSLKLVGVSLNQALPDVDTVALKEVSTTLTGRVSLSENKQLVTAFYPIILGARVGEIRPYRTGILHLRYDLSFAKALQRHSLERQALVMAGFYTGCFLLLGIFLHLVFARRVGRLVAAARRFADGELSVQTGIKGKDELARIGSAFDQMAREIAGNQETLHRLNRELRAISSCNQTLMRADDEQTLLGDICRIVCNEAGYRMAWVGYAENDDAKTIRPVTWAGVEDGYLSNANITWADTERGQGPSGTAIRTGKTDCIQNFAMESKAAPWREKALQRGYQSSISIPLKDEKTLTFGVLNIYSTMADSFTDEEISLLEELAGDLAFGIVILRARIERKRAEGEIRHLKNYLSNIIDSMPSLLVGIDRDEHVTQWNRQAVTLTGIPAAEAFGKPITQLLPDYTSWIATMRDEIRQRHPASLEKLLIEKEGERHFYDLMLYPLIANGVEGTVIRIEDVTERTRIQELMIQTEKMMSVGGLAAGMAHEINNPLGIITQAAQNIERRISPSLPANHAAAAETGVSMDQLTTYFESRQIPTFIASIREAAARASRIITNILRFSRRTEAAMLPASLVDIMEQALELAANDYDLKKKYDFRSIRIIRNFTPDLPDVPVVSMEIEQVLLNLLKNAAQAMTVNPPERPPHIELRIRLEKRYAVLEIEDNGTGMTEEIKKRVFEPFFTTKEPGIGTGLGLSVSYMIVTQNHKGLMQVESSPGNGTCFTVRLPIEKGEHS